MKTFKNFSEELDEAKLFVMPKDRMPNTRTHIVNGWEIKYLPALRKWSIGGTSTAETKAEAIEKASRKPGPQKN